MSDGAAYTCSKETMMSDEVPGDAPTTAPFTHPAASAEAEDKPITVRTAAAATSIDFITSLLVNRASVGAKAN